MMNEFLILLFLANNSANIYEIKKYIDKSFAPFLTVSTGAIIPALNRLEKSGCVQRDKTLSEGGLKRSIYSLTPNGEKYIEQYLHADISGAPQLIRREIEILMMLTEEKYFDKETKKVLVKKIKNALEKNILQINDALMYGKMNTEYLNMELVYSEAKLRMLNDIENSGTI